MPKSYRVRYHEVLRAELFGHFKSAVPTFAVAAEGEFPLTSVKM